MLLSKHHSPVLLNTISQPLYTYYSLQLLQLYQSQQTSNLCKIFAEQLNHRQCKHLKLQSSSCFFINIDSHFISRTFYAEKVVISCYLTIDLFLKFFIVDLNFLVPAVTAKIFIPTAKLVIPTGTQINEAILEIRTQAVIFQAEISNFLI